MSQPCRRTAKQCALSRAAINLRRAGQLIAAMRRERAQEPRREGHGDGRAVDLVAKAPDLARLCRPRCGAVGLERSAPCCDACVFGCLSAVMQVLGAFAWSRRSRAIQAARRARALAEKRWSMRSRAALRSRKRRSRAPVAGRCLRLSKPRAPRPWQIFRAAGFYRPAGPTLKNRRVITSLRKGQ